MEQGNCVALHAYKLHAPAIGLIGLVALWTYLKPHVFQVGSQRGVVYSDQPSSGRYGDC